MPRSELTRAERFLRKLVTRPLNYPTAPRLLVGVGGVMSSFRDLLCRVICVPNVRIYCENGFNELSRVSSV